MRILVTSDIHGRKSNFFDAVEMHINDTDLFINLGDNNSGKDLEDAEIYFGNKLRLKTVSGNCDFSSNKPFCEIFNFAGKKVLICHGHTFYVKHGLEMLQDEANKQNVDLVLFGHTHVPMNQKINSVRYFNPGALCDGCYGLIDFSDGEIMCINAKL